MKYDNDLRYFDRWLEKPFQNDLEDPTEEELSEADRLWEEMKDDL